MQIEIAATLENTGGNVTEKTQELKNLLDAIHTLESQMAKVRERDEAREMLIAAQHTSSMMNDFRRQLSDIYLNPEKAFDYFAALSMSEGPNEAIARFTEDPEKPSTLKGWSLGPLYSSARSAIIKLSLPMAMKTGNSAFSNHIKAGGGAYGAEDLKLRIEKLSTRVEHLDQVAGANGDRISLELRVAEASRLVNQSELRRLSREHLKLIEDLNFKCRPLLIEAAAKKHKKKTSDAAVSAHQTQNAQEKSAIEDMREQAVDAEYAEEPMAQDINHAEPEILEDDVETDSETPETPETSESPETPETLDTKPVEYVN